MSFGEKRRVEEEGSKGEERCKGKWKRGEYRRGVKENGGEEREISADELLANIQSVVDELHLDYSSSNGGSPEVS